MNDKNKENPYKESYDLKCKHVLSYKSIISRVLIYFR